MRSKLFLLFLLPILALFGCQQGSEPAGYTPADLDILVENGVFSETLEVVAEDVPFALYRLADYDLAPEDLTECALIRSAGATCEEGAVLVLADETKAETAREALEDYLAAQIEGNLDYRPAEIPKLESALLDRRGNTLLLVVGPDAARAEELLK